MRYVDDCFVIKSYEEDNEILFQQLNEAHEAIKFTNECEANSQPTHQERLIDYLVH